MDDYICGKCGLHLCAYTNLKASAARIPKANTHSYHCLVKRYISGIEKTLKIVAKQTLHFAIGTKTGFRKKIKKALTMNRIAFSNCACAVSTLKTTAKEHMVYAYMYLGNGFSPTSIIIFYLPSGPSVVGFFL